MEVQIALLSALQKALKNFNVDEGWKEQIHLACIKNRWFEWESVAQSLKQWQHALEEPAIHQFITKYPWKDNFSESEQPLLGLILAGNIPLVGLQDVVNGVLCGYKIKAKLSSDDEILIPYLLKKAAEWEPRWSDQITWSEDLKGIDAAIATGSNNSSRYFEYYFRNIPHIIRKNRNSIAVLSGEESQEEIEALGRDVFDYFGLGCRNVTHILLPDNYDLGTLFRCWDEIYLNSIVNHNKYVNNYHYHKALLLMNLDPHVDTGYVIAKESDELYAPVGMLHYSYYRNEQSVMEKLKLWGANIQVVASNNADLRENLINNQMSSVPLGTTQCTTLLDFADNIDTVDWLLAHYRVKASH